jgi:Glycosyl hydrolases family 2, TIM barrel domain/Glycosyl hydrolases family 2/Glycosyl hydrolases family 2, sugar binding domain
VRQRLSLDGAWEFAADPARRFDPVTLSQAARRPIQVPGAWQAQFADLRDYTGVAWYRRTFRWREPPAPEGVETVHLLGFGAVDYFATVWLNGVQVGEHEGGYLPFELPVDAALRLDDENELVVRVIDPGSGADADLGFPFAEIPHGKQSWYGPVGGIWQSVFLERRSADHLRAVRVTPDVAGERAAVQVVLSRPASRALQLELTLTTPSGGVERSTHHVAAGDPAPVLDLPVRAPELWDPDAPRQYRLASVLGDEVGTPLDEHTDRFGMRTIGSSPDGYLLLNGRPVYLRGALDQDYYPHGLYTAFSDAELDQQFARAKHMGLNCLRTHIKIADPRYYDAADRAGVLIWTELPNWQDLTEPARQRAYDTMVGMVERDWNHPSIVIWTIVNENWGTDLAVNAAHRSWLVGMYTELKRLDPQRLVVGNSPCFTNFHVVTDIEDFHNYYAMPDHHRQWQEWVQAFAARPAWTFAREYAGIERWREYLRDPWNPQPAPAAAEVRRRGNEPIVVSEFGNWGLPDIERLQAAYGGEPWWFETGIEWGEGVMYPHAIEQRYRAYHLDKVFPTLRDLTTASQRMQYTALKYEIEQMRRYPSIVGYIITEFTDVHWEANGLLDICRNPKAYYDVIGKVNSADAIVPMDWDRIAFWEGERCEVRLGVSHFSTLDLRDCRIEWFLDKFPDLHGSFDQIGPNRAQLTTVGTVAFTVPAVEQADRVRLQLRLVTPEGREVCTNHHELYFFPRRAAPPRPRRLHAPDAPRLSARLGDLGFEMTDAEGDAEIVVVETLTDRWRSYAQNGGRVLWLAENPESYQTHLGSWGLAARHGRSWQGDWASSMSWLRQDRIFQGIPTGGTVDFAFADLTPETVIVGLSPRDYAANVHSGLFVGWVHHIVALVAERRIDRGRLLVCTYRLRDHLGVHPVATVMMQDMLARLAEMPVGDR